MNAKSFFLPLVVFVWAFQGVVGFAQDINAQDINSHANHRSPPERAVPIPKVIIFDVNETLLDLAPLKQSVGKALGGREDLLPLWFSTMLHYSLVETLSGEYHSFGEIGTAALMMVAETQGIQLQYEEAKTAIVTPLRSLPPHEDVVAGLTDLFEHRYTVDSVKKFKPHPDTYRLVLDDLGVAPEEALMVAAHAWDLAGAHHVGLQTAFVSRPGKTLYPHVARPDHVVNDLQELVKRLQPSRQHAE